MFWTKRTAPGPMTLSPFMLAAEWLIDEGDMSGAISYLARAEDYSEIHKLRYQALLEWLRANVNPADDKVR